MSRIRIKVCCISSVHEAEMAVAAGADALGLVGRMPSGPGVVADADIARIAAGVPAPVARFLLTSETEPDAIIAHARFCGTDTVQLVDRVEPEHFVALRNGLPSVRLVQVLHVESKAQIDEAKEFGELADVLLLDSGRPSATVKELGGTGRVHDWALSAEIVRVAPCPVFLAGGLNAKNVARAIREVKPFGLDLCSGVRTDGALDSEKLQAFIRAVG